MSDEKNPAGETPGGEPLDVDSVFAAIVADWSRVTPESERSWPAAEDAGPELSTTSDDSRDPFSRDEPAPPGPVGTTPLLPEGARDPVVEHEDDEEGYVPPDPPPLPHLDFVGSLAWAGALGGPMFLLFAVIFWRTAPQILLMLAIVAFVGGFVTLVARMPQHRSDDGDDGAVV